MAVGLGTVSSVPIDSVSWHLIIRESQKMSNADYLIAYPTLSGSNIDWSLSHRLPGSGSHGDPRMATSGSNTLTFFTLVPNLSSSTSGSPYTTVAWLRALQVPPDYPTSSSVSNANVDPSQSIKMIYASASKSVDSTSETAEIEQHNNAFGSFSMDVSQPPNLAASDPVGGGGTQQKSTGWTKRDKVLVAHGEVEDSSRSSLQRSLLTIRRPQLRSDRSPLFFSFRREFSLLASDDRIPGSRFIERYKLSQSYS